MISTAAAIVATMTLLLTGAIAGLFYAFSVSVMPALDRISAEHAILAMQSINRKIENAVFFAAFVGTPIAAIVTGALLLSDGQRDGRGGTCCAPCSPRPACCSPASPSSSGAARAEPRDRSGAAARSAADEGGRNRRDRRVKGAMTTIRSSAAAVAVPAPGPPPPPALDPRSCEWGPDLRALGLQTGLPAAYRVGISVLALFTLGGAALTAFLAPDSGAGPDLMALALLAVSAVPWARWGIRDDDGPSWSFAALVLAPLAALGVGRWATIPIGLGSDPAYCLASVPALLLVLLYAAFAPVRMREGVVIAAGAAVVLPLLAGRAWDGQPAALTAAAAWLIGFALCVLAGYAVRLSYIASRRLTEAREVLASQAAADQRRRVAQDVHDVVAHTLAITMLHITAARMAVRRSSPDEAVEALEEAERQGRASLNDIRRIVRLLRSDDTSALDAAQPDLAEVEALAESYRAAGLPVHLSLEIDGRYGSRTAELAIYRVLQEALANAARHGCCPATVRLRAIDGAISLEVDNPVRQPAARPSPGSGLLGMRERIAAAGGTIEAGAHNGRWVVRAVVPAEGRA